MLIALFVIFNKCTRIIFDDENIKKYRIETTINNEEKVLYSLEEQPIKYKIDTKQGRSDYFNYIC